MAERSGNDVLDAEIGGVKGENQDQGNSLLVLLKGGGVRIELRDMGAGYIRSGGGGVGTHVYQMATSSVDFQDPINILGLGFGGFAE